MSGAYTQLRGLQEVLLLLYCCNVRIHNLLRFFLYIFHREKDGLTPEPEPYENYQILDVGRTTLSQFFKITIITQRW